MFLPRLYIIINNLKLHNNNNLLACVKHGPSIPPHVLPGGRTTVRFSLDNLHSKQSLVCLSLVFVRYALCMNSVDGQMVHDCIDLILIITKYKVYDCNKWYQLYVLTSDRDENLNNTS